MHVNIEDPHSFRYATADHFWKPAHGIGLRHSLDSLDSAQTECVRPALVGRMRQHQRSVGLYVTAMALFEIAAVFGPIVDCEGTSVMAIPS